MERTLYRAGADPSSIPVHVDTSPTEWYHRGSTAADFGVAPGKVISQLSGCSFSYSAGTAQRGGILTVEVSISDSGETINLLHQIHVVNVP